MSKDILYEIVMSDKQGNSANPLRDCSKEEELKNDGENCNQQDMGTNVPNIVDDPRGNIFVLNIIGHIEGHILSNPDTKTTKYEHVLPALVGAAQNPRIDGVLILLNTAGGDVEAGLAISEIISTLGKPTVSLVIGGGHSIGVPLAASSTYSFIAPSATMTIHPVRLSGTIIGAPQTYDYFEKMQERILNFIVNNSNINKEKLKSLMLATGKLTFDVGTLLIGEEAVKIGLINEVGGIENALNKLYALIKIDKNNQ